MMNLRDKEALYTTKEEGDATNASTTAAPSSSRQWSSSGLKNPRIVRVSRTFGGKDRHSKVCTIKGLRDRRIRLSVPTAIQLYDLQDRLGLGQPSKVIDWLLDITKHDIDKLPPLPAIPGSFPHFQQDTHTSQGYGISLSSSNNPFMDASLFPFRKEGGININRQSLDVNEDPSSLVAKLKYWDASNASMRSKQKEIDDDDDDDQGGIGVNNNNNRGNSQVLAQNFFPIASGSNNNHPSPFLSNNNHPMYNYYHWEPSNLSLTHQLGNHGLISSQNEHHHHHQGHPSNSSSLPSPLALSSGSQLLVSPSMASSSSLFPPHASYVSTLHPQVENDIRQFNRFHVANYPFNSTQYTSNGLGLKPFPLSMTHHSHLHQNDDDHDKNDDAS